MGKILAIVITFDPQCRKIPEDRVIHMAQEEEGDGRQSHLLEEVDVKLVKKFDPSHLEDMQQGKKGSQRPLEEMGDLVDEKEESNMINGHVDGGLPLISDSVFSLIIMVKSLR